VAPGGISWNIQRNQRGAPASALRSATASTRRVGVANQGRAPQGIGRGGGKTRRRRTTRRNT